MQRRNPTTKEYRPYTIPKEWYCPIVVEDMETKINCANCWKETTFWNCYTSTQIFEDCFWYPVCEQCYQDEKK